MTDECDNEQQVLQSWSQNVVPWTRAVRGGEIASREQVTNNAVVDAVLACKPASVLDIGCGEGWLCRTLTTHGIRTTGVDAIGALVEAARSAGTDARVGRYDELLNLALPSPFDMLVCNFSLIGKQAAEQVCGAAPALLRNGGHVIVQTLHPNNADRPTQSGWRPGSWQGFSDDFCDPAPWYFRSLEDWQRLFTQSGLTLIQTLSPRRADDPQPASILFVAQAN